MLKIAGCLKKRTQLIMCWSNSNGKERTCMGTDFACKMSIITVGIASTYTSNIVSQVDRRGCIQHGLT